MKYEVKYPKKKNAQKCLKKVVKRLL